MTRSQPLTEGTYYILLSLIEPNHGYGIIQRTLELTGGRLELGAGTLYGAINNLLEKGWIALYSEEKESRKKKEYVMTRIGRAALEEELERLEELLGNGRKLLDAKEKQRQTDRFAGTARNEIPGGLPERNGDSEGKGASCIIQV